jgi:hypothetical protein
MKKLAFTGLITPSRVFGIAAFVYNVAAGLAGGMELTLSDRD